MNDHSPVGVVFRRKGRILVGRAHTLILSLLMPLLLLWIWWFISEISSSMVLPPPLPVLRLFVQPEGTSLYIHLQASIIRVAAALATATLAALPVGFALGSSIWTRRIVTPIVYVLYPVPKIALLPLVFLFIGVGEGARIFLVWLVLFFQVLVAVRDAVVAIPEEYHRSLTLLGGRPVNHLRYVIIPAILPALLTALRIGSATAFAVLFFAETFFTDRGLGFFIVDSWMKADYTSMMAGIVAIGTAGFLVFSVLDVAQRLLCRWKRYE